MSFRCFPWQAFPAKSNSSSRGVIPSDLHSYSKRRFIGPLVSLSLRQWEALIGFLRKWVELSLVNFLGVLFYPPSHPPPRGGNSSHCSGNLSGLVGWGNFLLWFSLDCWFVVGKLGMGGVLESSWSMVQKFFNRSPITLKFGAEKIERERESQKERARARARASSCCIYARKLLFYTSKLLFLYFVSCYSTLVSCYSTLVICHSTLVSWLRSWIAIAIAIY